MLKKGLASTNFMYGALIQIFRNVLELNEIFKIKKCESETIDLATFGRSNLSFGFKRLN